MPHSKIPVSDETLKTHLSVQVQFLRRSCRDFDAGEEAEFARIAVILRILFHKGRQARPLIELAGANNFGIPSYAIEIDPNELLGVYPLACYQVSDGKMKCVAMLDAGNVSPKILPYKTWWDEAVLRGHDRTIFSRRELVLHIADQDGGAHVDPTLDRNYHKLKNLGAFAMSFTGPDSVRKPIMDIEKAYMRHFAFEVLSAFKLTGQ